MTDVKQCVKCRKVKPVTGFYVERRRNSLHVRAECKACKCTDSRRQQKERQMNVQKIKSIYNGLVPQMRKVYDFTPTSTPWNANQYQNEMLRVGSQMDHRTLMSALSRLKESGIIREPTAGCFIRTPVSAMKQATVVEPQPEPESTMTQQQAAPIQVLGDLALQAIQLSNLCKKLSADIEAAGVMVDDHINQAAKDSARLKQLQDLLKG